MKKNLIVFVLFIVSVGVIAISQGVISIPSALLVPPDPQFTVELRDGRKVQVTSIYYSPLIGWDRYESDKCFSLHNDIGNVDVYKDLQDVQSIQVLNKSGEELKVTFLSGYSVEGTRISSIDKYISDYIKGKSGKLKVNLPLEKIASITRN